MKSKSKRRKNLTEKELMKIATNYGVNEIYSMLVNDLAPHFDRTGTTRSSMKFSGKLFSAHRKTESTVAIFSLIPVGSTEQNGLKFQMYLQRFSTYFKIEKTKVVSILPKQHKEWKFEKDATPEYSGYEGFFKTMDEAQHFLNEISKIQK